MPDTREQSTSSRPGHLSAQRRFAFGAIGALFPIVAGLLTIDFVAVSAESSPVGWLGYGVRIVVLALIGGLAAYMQKEEKTEFKAFQVGLTWPAFLTAGTVSLQSAGQYNEVRELDGQVEMLLGELADVTRGGEAGGPTVANPIVISDDVRRLQADRAIQQSEPNVLEQFTRGFAVTRRVDPVRDRVVRDSTSGRDR